MNFNFYLSISLLALAFVNTTTSNSLENFVKDKMANYVHWLKENNLDPSALVTGPTLIKGSYSGAQVECSLRNHRVKGHSGNINVTSGQQMGINTISMSFVIQANTTFSGIYNGKASYFGQFIGDGSWNITFPEINYQNVTFNYALSPNGYLLVESFNVGEITVPSPSFGQVDAHFENLWEDESRGYIQQALHIAFEEYLPTDPLHPLKQSINQYLNAIFAETTFEEIIRGSSCPSNDVITTEQKEMVLEEKIVDRQNSIGADGVPVIIRRKVVITEERLEL